MPFSLTCKENLREKLAAAYRIIARLNMDDLTYTHISARLPDENGFLLAPFGLLFEEIEADMLLEMGCDGKLLAPSSYAFNPTALTIHGELYKARPDVGAIFHLHTSASIAVSAMKEGLRPVSQHALHFYDRVAYHGYESLAQHTAIGEAMARDLGHYNVMLLRNHGSLTAGATVEEAFFYAYHLERACQAQVMMGSGPLIEVPAHVATHTRDQMLSFESHLGVRDFEALWRQIRHRS